MATGSGARQTAPAFQESFNLRGAPVSAGASDAVLQIGNSEKSMGDACRNGNACAPHTPSGAANAAAAPPRNSDRRSISGLRL
jgi:hypothetical protein